TRTLGRASDRTRCARGSGVGRWTARSSTLRSRRSTCAASPSPGPAKGAAAWSDPPWSCVDLSSGATLDRLARGVVGRVGVLAPAWGQRQGVAFGQRQPDRDSARQGVGPARRGSPYAAQLSGGRVRTILLSLVSPSG